MGGVLISNQSIDTWSRESQQAASLLNMQSEAEVHKQLIKQCKWDNSFKRTAMCLLGLSFGLSIHRYFPDFLPRGALFTGMYLLTLMQPFHMWAIIASNRDTIAVLSPVFQEMEAEQKYQKYLLDQAKQKAASMPTE
jgi:hypothetical protein